MNSMMMMMKIVIVIIIIIIKVDEHTRHNYDSRTKRRQKRN